MTSVLIGDRRRGTDQRGKGHVSTEAEAGVMQPQAKRCLELPEAGRHKEWDLL